MMAVKAPFSFARINRWVHEPAWGHLANHDVPFADGVSGQATITLKTITPTLVGGERRDATKEQEGAVWPFKVGDDYAIPASSMQGMCRTILEIAGFGRLGLRIDNRKFGIRDLTNTETARIHYRERLAKVDAGKKITPYTRAGFLVKQDDSWAIIPCEMSRIHVDDVMALRNSKLEAAGKRTDKKNPLYDGKTADIRYDDFLKDLGGRQTLDASFVISPNEWHDHQDRRIQIWYSRCRPSSKGNATPGRLVLTGKPKFRRDLNPVGPRMKKWEFVFFNQRPEERIIIDPAQRDTFLQLHDPNHGVPNRSGDDDKDINPTWKYWKRDFEKGHPIPVFFLSTNPNTVDTFGMAYSFKVAHTHSTHDLLGFSNTGHTEAIATAPLDMASLIFGTAAEGNEGRGLKRRAWFGLGISKSRKPVSNLGNPVVLLNPKPSYAGIYVRQHGRNGQVEKNKPYSSYTPVPGPAHQSSPELAGVKLWPASRTSPEPISVGQLPREIAENRQVQNTLFPVAENTVFKIPLTFHNLRRVELGALLWTLSFGDVDALSGDPEKVRKHHRIGLGKPLGLGEIAISVDLSVDDCTDAAEDYVRAFVDYMESEYRSAANGSWSESLQVKSLLKTSDPTENDRNELKYMPLSSRDRNEPGTYVSEKQAQRFLVDYVNGHEAPRPKADQSSSGIAEGSKNPTPTSPAGPILYHQNDGDTFYHKVTEDAYQLLEDALEGGYVRVVNLADGKTTQVPVDDLEIE